MRTREIEHKGCRLHCEVSGSGTPVLLIQGAGVHGGGWRPQVEALADRYQCVTFDNRGIGLSQPRGASLSIDQMAEDAIVLMDALGVERAHVAGHSLGGLAALQVALVARPRVLSLSLLCTFATGRVPTRFSSKLFWLGLRTRVGTRKQRRSAFMDMVMPGEAARHGNPAQLARELAELFGHDLADQPAIVMQQLSGSRTYNAIPRLNELASVPTLVVSATEDLIAPVWAGRQLAQSIPGSRYIEIANAGHAAPLQRRHEINALLLDHLAGKGQERTS